MRSLLRQQGRTDGNARDLLGQSISRHLSREDLSHHNFQAVATTAARRDTNRSCVNYHRQDLADQDLILAHLSRRKRKDITLILFQEVGDQIDRVSSSSSKAVFSRSRNFRYRDGRYMLRSL